MHCLGISLNFLRLVIASFAYVNKQELTVFSLNNASRIYMFRLFLYEDRLGSVIEFNAYINFTTLDEIRTQRAFFQCAKQKPYYYVNFNFSILSEASVA